MSNPLTKMRELQALMASLQDEIQSLQNNPQLKLELQFETELRELLKKHDKSIQEAVQVVDPSFRIVSGPVRKSHHKKADDQATSRGKSSANTQWYNFRNPHTGEVVRAANILKAKVQEWIHEHGKEEVLSWREL